MSYGLIKPRVRVVALPACMGGMCAVRNTCARYHQEQYRSAPAERLCGPHDHDIWHPLVIREVDADEVQPLLPSSWPALTTDIIEEITS